MAQDARPQPLEHGQIRLPARDLYWCVVEPNDLPKPARTRRDVDRSREALDALFEEQVPCDFDELHAVYSPAGDGRVIGCAVAIARLEREIDERTRQAQPDTVPEGIGSGVDASEFELLTGRFEPASVRRSRGRTVVIAATLWLAAVLMVFAGGQARVGALLADAREVNERTERIMRSTVGEQAAASGQPIVALFESERNLARQSTEPTLEDKDQTDLVEQFRAIAELWPTEPARRVRRLEILPDRILIVAATDDAEATRAFEEPFSSLAGWSTRGPSINTTESESIVRIQLDRVAEEAK